MREQSCAPHALTRCAPALPFAQELKLWDGDVTLELGHLGLPAGAHLQCRTVCLLRWRETETQSHCKINTLEALEQREVTLRSHIIL